MAHHFLKRLRLAAAAALVAIAGPLAQAAESIVLASTTSTEQSGLFGHILPIFEKESGITVKVVALGTGQALDVGRRGDADALLVHDRPAEDRFVRISGADVGEPGCGGWESRPRLGLIGMLAGWWEIKVSSGCPLAMPGRPRPADRLGQQRLQELRRPLRRDLRLHPAALGARLRRRVDRQVQQGPRGRGQGAAAGDPEEFGLVVDENRARSADPVLASEVRSGEPKFIPQHVGEQPTGLDIPGPGLAVHLEPDSHACLTTRSTNHDAARRR